MRDDRDRFLQKLGEEGYFEKLKLSVTQRRRDRREEERGEDGDG